MFESGGADEPEIESYVADCPVGPELVGQIVELAALPWDEPGVADRAVRDLGWSTRVPIDGASFVTAAGHAVYTGSGLYMPFVHSYDVGGELSSEDFWGTLPGWTSRRGAGRAEFGAHVDAVIDQFAGRLGAPEWDVRAEGRRISLGSYSWRYAAWRRGSNVLVIGPALDSYSYSQDEEAVVYIGRLAEEAPFPAAAELLDFMRV
ncbi:hypothetical protein ACI2K4_01335 [Micromonospora sp. NPDC050397]|uniref:hypothetical protein n=1 Tax=Micromonospora sp. NPDC050397 TaxID=3364279 RepID=UPI00384B6C18